MRTTGKQALILGLVVLLASAVALGQGTPAATSGKGKRVQKRGKVEAGVEGGCLVLRDTGDHKLYNLLLKGDKPKPGDEISFSGTMHDGPTTCMEGIAVSVTSWKLIKTASAEPRNLVAP